MKAEIGKRQYIFYGFLILEFIIYLSFLFLDLTNNDSYNLSSIIKYSGILLCGLFQLIYYFKCNTDIILLRLAIIGTCISDYFLLLTNKSEVGVTFFIFVQLCYMIKLQYDSMVSIDNNGIERRILRKVCRNYGVIVINVVFVRILCWLLKYELDGLTQITLIYFQSLLCNVFLALKQANKRKYKDKQSVIFAIAMVLFLLCDINVGLFNITSGLCNREGAYQFIYYISSIAMWLFYLPSQVMISISNAEKY